jgi:hypothetical protein
VSADRIAPNSSPAPSDGARDVLQWDDDPARGDRAWRSAAPHADLVPLVDLKRLMQEDTIAMAFSIMNNRQKQKFKDHLEIDIAYSVPGLGRFRCNIFQQRERSTGASASGKIQTVHG